ncbi:MAG: type II secretion system protein [bacterium]|nr:type II secretion system protein [bacterium]
MKQKERNRITPKKPFSYSNGFSLIEIITVVAIVSLLAAAGTVSLVSARERQTLKDGESIVLHGLERARSRATAGIGNSDHGLHIEESRIVSFEGESYDGSGNTILLPGSVETNQSDANIVFNRISGTASPASVITITNSSGTKTITVTENGAISND